MSQVTPLKTTLLQLFSDNLAGILDFLILQDKYNFLANISVVLVQI
jgi:hypothetical protein